MCYQRKSEGDSGRNSPRALLWFAFSQALFYLTDPTRLNEHRRFGVSGNRRARRQVWAQGIQDTKDPPDHHPRLDCLLPGYLHVSLRTRDDTAIGEGEYPHDQE